jgi:hypothetical protein
MKVAAFLVPLLLVACGPQVTSNSSNVETEESAKLIAFPDEYRGVYECVGDYSLRENPAQILKGRVYLNFGAGGVMRDSVPHLGNNGLNNSEIEWRDRVRDPAHMYEIPQSEKINGQNGMLVQLKDGSEALSVTDYKNGKSESRFIRRNGQIVGNGVLQKLVERKVQAFDGEKLCMDLETVDATIEDMAKNGGNMHYDWMKRGVKFGPDQTQCYSWFDVKKSTFTTTAYYYFEGICLKR